MIQIRCDDCEKMFEIPDDQAGQKVACPYCGDVNRVGSLQRPVADSSVVGKTPPSGPAAKPGPVSMTPVGKLIHSDQEQVIAVVRQAMFRAHPFWYSLMVLILIGGIILAVMGSQGNQPGARFPHWTMYAGFVAIGIAVIWWLTWWAAPHRWIKLTITNKRSIRQEGIVMRKTSEVLHRHVVNVTIRQGLMDRIFGVGYIGIDSAGQGGEPEGDEDNPQRRGDIEIEVADVPHPYRIKDIIDRYR